MAFRLGWFCENTWKESDLWDTTLPFDGPMTPNATWFAVDTGLRIGKMVSRGDFDPNVARTIQERVSGDEAIFVVTELSFLNWWDSHRRILGGTIEDCELQVSLEELAGMNGYLVTQDRVFLLNDAPGIGFDSPDRFGRPDLVRTLFADD